ncbi:putative transcription regulator mTERF family [Medicago truncatula]|uniref:Putative transcription regulator mTERF family n=1 Tax=Medicago truncatula TaxID=3880 RepID=A0A072UFU8_MEDTR|nr:uncharacterized protein LOC25491192 [Medicago truncatula]KEH28557.1 transcription termination factor family protein [Medicago truncatula]RHN58382.1 putative transcription regulator mTERF family [Medicago truncatula]
MYHFLIARFTHTHRTLHRHNTFSLFSVVCNTDQHKGDTFTLLSLINSCGLSPEKALKLSTRLQLINPNGPNAVIQLFRSYGFSDSQLSSLVKKHPFVLLSKSDKTLLPKLKFLQSIGASTIDFPKILIGDKFLTASLEKTIIPRYKILKSLVCDDKKVVLALRRGSWNFYNDSMVNDSVPNIEVLRKLGVPQSSISSLVSNFPCVAFTKHSRFVEAVNSVKEMGFDPSKLYFVLAIRVIVSMDKEIWESKFKIFEKWGWSRDICRFAFLKYPEYVMISEKKIMKTMDFLVKDVGLAPEDIATCPGILTRNLEKTLVPKCAVIKILKSRGLVKSGLRVSTFIMTSEEKFVQKYVTPFQKDLPLLLDAYKVQKSD